MTQWVKVLPCKCDDQSSGPQNTHKSQILEHVGNLSIPVFRREVEVGDSWTLQGQLAWSMQQ